MLSFDIYPERKSVGLPRLSTSGFLAKKTAAGETFFALRMGSDFSPTDSQQ
jgi:hypothetical protein